MSRAIILFLLFSNSAMGMQISYEYPNNKKAMMIKVYKDKGSPYILRREDKSEISRRISNPLYDQIDRNFKKIVGKKKQTEFSCPKRIKLAIVYGGKTYNYCKSIPLKKTVAKLFNKLNKISIR